MQQADSLDTMTRDQILAGPSEVKHRDQAMPQFQRAPRAQSAEGNYTVWELKQQPGPTKAFRTGGSFNAMISSGKISLGQDQQKPDTRRTYLPGYTGFQRGRQHISGRTFGETSRLANDIAYTEHVRTSPIPSNPQANRKIPHDDLKDRFMYGVTKNEFYQVPGYTGHVPGQRAAYSNTYGSSTKTQMANFQAKHQRRHPQEKPGYAYTSKARDFYHIDSTPLPGDINCVGAQPPRKVLPGHLQYVQYFAL